MSRVLKHLPLSQWPEVDRSLFERTFRQAADPFDDDAGAGAHLKPRTATAIRFAYRRWLGWLAGNHPGSLALDPAERVTRDQVRAYADALALTMRSVALAAHVARLYDVIRYMYPERDWSWLRAIKQRLEASAEPAPRPAPPFDSMALQDLGFNLMAEAETKLIAWNGKSRREARGIAELHRDGLIIALAALLPLRRGNLSALTIDDSLCQVDQLWAVRIPETKNKSGRSIDAVRPITISRSISRHVDLFRPLFFGSTNHKGLWCSFYRGEALTDTGLYMAIRKRVGQSTGHWISLHDFARIAATSIAIYDPCNVASASQLLGHMDARVTSAHYNRARGVVASRRMALLIEAARKTRGERLNASDRRCRPCRVDIGRMVCLRSADLCLGPAHSSRQWRHLGER
jgi:integrase